MNENILIDPLAKIIGLDRIKFGSPVRIDCFSLISVKSDALLIIGSYVHIAVGVSLMVSENVVLKDFTGISHGCRLFTATDDFEDWGFGGPLLPREFRNVRTGRISLGKFCVLGANTVVLPGVEIGEGTTVGANTVVTRSLEPWGVYLGNKRIKERNKNGVLATYEKFLRTPQGDEYLRNSST